MSELSPPNAAHVLAGFVKLLSPQQAQDAQHKGVPKMWGALRSHPPALVLWHHKPSEDSPSSPAQVLDLDLRTKELEAMPGRFVGVHTQSGAQYLYLPSVHAASLWRQALRTMCRVVQAVEAATPTATPHSAPSERPAAMRLGGSPGFARPDTAAKRRITPTRTATSPSRASLSRKSVGSPGPRRPAMEPLAQLAKRIAGNMSAQAGLDDAPVVRQAVQAWLSMQLENLHKLESAQGL